MRSRLRRVVDDHLTEVVCRPQRVRGHDPDLDEVREVAVLVKRGQPFDRVRRQGIVVPSRDLEQGLRPDRPLQVDVQLDFWPRRCLRRHQRAAARFVSARRQRRSIRTESQIESSNRISSGTASKTRETGSTVGSRTAITTMTT